MSPEYAMEGAFSVKSDTCSFGVLLLEIVSGLKMTSPNFIIGFPNLIVYVSTVLGLRPVQNYCIFLPTQNTIAH
jgi:hypothetical protein